MNGEDTTVESLIAELQKCHPKAIVRVAVVHDLDVDLCTKGPICGIRKKTKKLVILDCSDDFSHGFGNP
jgi:hypothetical protein